jgi:hypothetical protein
MALPEPAITRSSIWVDCGGSGEAHDVGYWHVRDVTPTATQAAVIKGAADMPAPSPFMLRPRCRP